MQLLGVLADYQQITNDLNIPVARLLPEGRYRMGLQGHLVCKESKRDIPLCRNSVLSPS
jgi:hypothetical protein